MKKIERLRLYIKKYAAKRCVRKNVLLSSLTTAGVGGRCSLFVSVMNEKDLILIMQEIFDKKISFKVIGKGSNLLFRDRGFNGVILSLAGDDFQKVSLGKTGICTGPSVSSKKLLRFCVRHGVGGMEFLAGIPGTIGGMLSMNAGAFSKSLGECVKKVKVLLPGMRTVWLDKKSLRFSYREAKGFPENAVILSAILKKRKCSPGLVREKVGVFLKKRAKNQPKGKTFGSVFKNPSKRKAWEIVEELGLRGYCSGAACVSQRHANWIINQGKASSSDIIRIIRKVQRESIKKLNIKMQTEVEII